MSRQVTVILASINPTTMCADLIIPSAKYIPEELQTIGKIPPLLYPIGSGTLFDLIYVQYATKPINIKIIGYEGFEMLRSGIPYNPKIQLIKIEKLVDLAHTLYHGLNDTEDKAIINFSDTFVEDNVFDAPDDCAFYSEEVYSDLWTFFKLKDGIIEEIIDKPKELSKTPEKLFVGVFKISNQKYFKQFYAKQSKMNSLYWP